VALAESTRRSAANHDRTDGFTDYEFHVFREARALRACFLWQFADRADEARTELRWFYEQAVERGDESSIPMLLLNLSGAEAILGNWTEARRLVEEAHEGSLEMGRQPWVEGWCLTQRAFLDAVLGRVTSSREAAERALTLADEAGANDPRVLTFPTLGLLELSLGRAAEAHEYLAGAVAGAEAAGCLEPGMCGFVTDDVEALIALGRLDEAELLLARHEQRASAVGRALALAACARCRGLLRAARADLAGALTALEDALAQHERLEDPFARGRTLLALGVTQRRAKKKAAGRETLERALAIFEELGARLWAERTRAELDRIGGRAGSRRELTPTEKQVAELVAAGHTNREVAAALSLSVRTVDWNLAKVFGKLGVHSRRELAALARRPTGS
jgi:DNA-binding CsgD family transcriptional regulator